MTTANTLPENWNEIEILSPEYSDGSAAKGWYQYSVLIQTKRPNFRQSRRVKGEKRTTRREAEMSAQQLADQVAVEFAAELANA